MTRYVMDLWPLLIAVAQGLEPVATALDGNGGLAIAVAVMVYAVVLLLRDVVIPLLGIKARNGKWRGKEGGGREWDTLTEHVAGIASVINEPHFREIGDRTHAIYKTIQRESDDRPGHKWVWGLPREMLTEHTKALEANTAVNQMVLAELQAGRGVMGQLVDRVLAVEGSVATLISRTGESI